MSTCDVQASNNDDTATCEVEAEAHTLEAEVT